MQTIKGKITLLFSEKGMSIRLDDSDAVIAFCDIELDAEQTCAAMSRQAHVPCVINVGGLENVGKVREHKSFSFPIGVDGYDRKKDVAIAACAVHCPEGWTPDNYFGSQGSFYTAEDGTQMARCMIMRWA